MRIAFKSIYLFILLSFPAFAYAGSQFYFVSENGYGAKNGQSLSNAWSVSGFNSAANWSKTDTEAKIDPGDTVYFSGTITSRLIPPSGYGGSAGKYITLDGWQEGTCNPVANNGCSSAAVIDRPSRSNSSSNWCIWSVNNSYLIIQDFNLKDSQGGLFASGPSDGSPSSHLIVRRNYIHDMEGKGAHITSGGSPSYAGINYVTFGGANGDGNLIYNCQQYSINNYSDSHSVGFANNDDLIVSYNRVDNDPELQDLGDASTTMSVHTGNRVLIEYNTIATPHGQACLSLKEFGGNEKIVRFNKFYRCGEQGGVSVSTNRAEQNNYYIYGNLVFDSAGGIRAYRNYDNIHIWSNVINNISAEPGTGQGGYGIHISDAGVPGNVFVYNNTITRCDIEAERSAAASGLRVIGAPSQKLRVKNNIFYYNVSNDVDRQIHIAQGDEANIISLDSNTYFTSGTPYVYYDGSDRNISSLKSYDFEYHAKVVDPGFTDPRGPDRNYGTEDDDYTLNGININDGDNLSECFDVSVQNKNYHMCYDDALDPAATNWRTNPPTVKTAKQGDNGSWERGAYVYKEGAKNTVSASAPAPPSPIWIVE